VPLFSFEGHEPVVHETAWIAPTAVIIGSVTIEENASVWFNVVLRADFGRIAIRAGANVQDGSVIHGGNILTEVGPGATIGHLCVIHGAVIGEEALIGNGTIVLDGARLGNRTLIAAGSTVSPNTQIPDSVVAIGSPARVRGELSGPPKEWVERNQEVYRKLARRYSSGSRQIDG
jgi:carbonic anhydrase/acetyltransferase-like protein (isoleucine patch superfamily)